MVRTKDVNTVKHWIAKATAEKAARWPSSGP